MLALTSDIASGTAKMTWKVLRKINSLLPEGDLPSPSWAPGRLLKQRERTPMAVGVPRRTQSLCPDCNREAVERVLKRSEEHTSELQSRLHLVCRLLLEKKKKINSIL